MLLILTLDSDWMVFTIISLKIYFKHFAPRKSQRKHMNVMYLQRFGAKFFNSRFQKVKRTFQTEDSFLLCLKDGIQRSCFPSWRHNKKLSEVWKVLFTLRNRLLKNEAKNFANYFFLLIPPLCSSTAPPGVKSDFLSLHFLSLGIKSDFLYQGVLLH